MVPILQRGFTRSVQEVEALRAQNIAERRLATIISSAQDAIILMDLDGGITDWNPAAEELYGYSAGEMIGQSIERLFPADLDEALERNMQIIAADERVTYTDTQRRAQNGEVIDVRISIAPVRDADGQVIGAASTAHDIRESKRNREALALSVERFRGTFDHAPIGLALVSPEGQFTEVNAALCKIVGYSNEELLQTTFQTITHPDDLDSDLALFQQLTNDEIKSYSLDKRYFHKNGSIVWIVLAASVVRDAQGQLLHFIAQIEDVTEARKTQEALAERSAELERSNEELEGYARVVSHDLREPLRGIAGFTQLLEKTLDAKLDDTTREYMHFISDNVERSQALINGLLEYSRAGGERETKNINCDALIASVFSSLQAQIESCGAKVYNEPLPAVHANELDVQRILQNLIGNALKFSAIEHPLDQSSENVPQVHVRAKMAGTMVRFEVCDNGPGIAPKFKTEVFRIFRRLHGHNVRGSGIGLAICKKLVESYGGTIGVESEPGDGSCFHFTLPAAESASV